MAPTHDKHWHDEHQHNEHQCNRHTKDASMNDSVNGDPTDSTNNASTTDAGVMPNEHKTRHIFAPGIIFFHNGRQSCTHFECMIVGLFFVL